MRTSLITTSGVRSSNEGEGGFGMLGRSHAGVGVGQSFRQGIPEDRVVVDDEDPPHCLASRLA